MTVTLPTWLRRTLYIITAVGAPVAAYARAKGYIGDLELTLWSGEVAVVSALAAFNASDTGAAIDEAHPVQGEDPPTGGF